MCTNPLPPAERPPPPKPPTCSVHTYTHTHTHTHNGACCRRRACQSHFRVGARARINSESFSTGLRVCNGAMQGLPRAQCGHAIHGICFELQARQVTKQRHKEQRSLCGVPSRKHHQPSGDLANAQGGGAHCRVYLVAVWPSFLPNDKVDFVAFLDLHCGFCLSSLAHC